MIDFKTKYRLITNYEQYTHQDFNSLDDYIKYRTENNITQEQELLCIYVAYNRE